MRRSNRHPGKHTFTEAQREREEAAAALRITAEELAQARADAMAQHDRAGAL